MTNNSQETSGLLQNNKVVNFIEGEGIIGSDGQKKLTALTREEALKNKVKVPNKDDDLLKSDVSAEISFISNLDSDEAW